MLPGGIGELNIRSIGHVNFLSVLNRRKGKPFEGDGRYRGPKRIPRVRAETSANSIHELLQPSRSHAVMTCAIREPESSGGDSCQVTHSFLVTICYDPILSVGLRTLLYISRVVLAKNPGKIWRNFLKLISEVLLKQRKTASAPQLLLASCSHPHSKKTIPLVKELTIIFVPSLHWVFACSLAHCFCLSKYSLNVTHVCKFTFNLLECWLETNEFSIDSFSRCSPHPFLWSVPFLFPRFVSQPD